MSSAFLDALSPTPAASLLSALPEGMRDAASWSTILRAIDNDRIDNVSNGINGKAVNRDYHGYVGENTQKWIVNEATEGVADWSRQDEVESQFQAVAPLRTKRAFHLLIGQNAYLPAWAVTQLGASPGTILDLIEGRINQVKAKFPGADPFYRIDVINEITNSATQTSQDDDRGWRLTNNAFRTASLDATTLASVLGDNAEKWIWDAFTLARAAFPNARLAWTDFSQEQVMSPDASTYPILGDPHNVSPFLTDNSTAINLHRANRLKYEIWRAKAAGVPIDVIGYQFHLSPVAPPEFVGLVAGLHDWNRFGITPAVTEFNVVNAGTSGSKIPPHVGSAGDARLERYAAWIGNRWLREMLRESPLEEITFWSVASNLNIAQTATKEGIDYPIRLATMLALMEAVAPARRNLKRGCLTDLQYSFPPWLTNSGATLSFASRRCAITVAGSLQVPWSFYSAPWMARPISNTHHILSAQFNLADAVSDDTVLLGYGIGSSGTPDNTVKIKVMANRDVVIEIRVLGTAVLSEVIGTAINAAMNRVAVRINGHMVQAALNGVATDVFIVGTLFTDPDTVYVLSNPAGDGTHSNLSIPYFEIQHGPDYPNDADLIALSTVRTRDCSLGIYSGDP